MMPASERTGPDAKTRGHATAMEEALTPESGPVEVLIRVRYSEIDGLGTFYNSRALEWFECGRTELLRSIGVPYTSMEARGVFLPLTESHVEYAGRARYDDLLRVITTARMVGKARVRCDVTIEHAAGKAPVARGYTVHAFVDATGKPIRPPTWFRDAMGKRDDRR
jgi:acyl-CoA thioester hydrolase